MTGRNQRESIARMLIAGTLPTPRGRFESNPAARHPGRVACVLCGMTGYGPLEPTGRTASPWQLAHMVDHPFRCRCGAAFLTPGRLATHITPPNWQYPKPDPNAEHGPAEDRPAPWWRLVLGLARGDRR